MVITIPNQLELSQPMTLHFATPPVRLVVAGVLDAMPPPRDGEVQARIISLSDPPFAEGELLHDLTVEEQARAERYKVASARVQFVFGRALLRRWLAQHIAVEPSKVPITYTGSGKPLLEGPLADLHFNVTHTDGLALIALARQEVGIDLERIRPVSEPAGLVQRFFSPLERELYRALPEPLRPGGFFRGWTCKEALIKAAALTVACLDEFDVELHPDRPASLLGARHPALSGRSWSLVTWEPLPGYAAAIATPALGVTTTGLQK